MASDWKKLMEALKDEDYEVEHQRGGHYGIFKDGKRVGTLVCSASDHRSWQNTLGQLRRQLNFDYRPKQTRSKKEEE